MFAVCFMHLQLRQEHKEEHMELQKARWGLDYRTVESTCSPESSYACEQYSDSSKVC